VVGLNLAALCCPPRRAAPATDPLLAAVAGSLPRTTSLVPSASSPRTTPATSHWSSIPARRMTRRSCRRPPSLAPPRWAGPGGPSCPSGTACSQEGAGICQAAVPSSGQCP